MLLKRSLLALFALIACGSPDVFDAGHDASEDAGHDAGRDDGRDAGRDDAGRADAGHDAGHDSGPDDPVWVPMPNLPARCDGLVERALYPERIFTPTWGACDPPAAGCRESVEARGFTGVGGHDGEQGYFVWAFGDPVRGEAWAHIGRTDGSSVAAWHYDFGTGLELGYSCSVGPFDIADGHAAFVVGHLYPDDRPQSEQLVYHAPVSEIGALEVPTARIPGAIAGYSSPQNVAVSRHLVALEMQPGGFVYVVTPDGSQENVSGAALGIPQSVRVVGEQIFWEDWNWTVQLARAGPLGPGEILWDAAPGEVKSFDASLGALAWVQGYDRPTGGEYQRIEVWTAPVPAPGAALEPRMVREIANRGHSSVGSGYYVTWVGVNPDDYVELVELATGRTKTWPFPDGTNVLGRPLYVTERDVLIVLLRPDGRRLVRLDPSAMPYDE